MRKIVWLVVLVAIAIIVFVPEVRQGLAPLYQRTIGEWTAPQAPAGAREYVKVYVERNGQYYHLRGCPELKGKSTFVTSLNEARGIFQPCPVCKPGQ